MIDIVERLRASAGVWHDDAVTDEAAAEIERLRAVIDASIRILSNDQSPLQSRINDARGILAR